MWQSLVRVEMMTTNSLQSSHTTRSSRRVRHDLAEALNVIGLAAEVGGNGVIDPLDALQQIALLVKDAGEHLDALEVPPSAAESERPDLAPGVATVDQASAQANILEGVVRHAPLAESLDAIVAAIEHQLPDTACSVLLLRRGSSLHHGAAAKLPAAYREAIDGVSIGLGQGSCGTAAFTGRPVVASDVTTDQNWVEFRNVATTHGLRSCWSTPIVAAEGGEVLGTFAVYKTKVWAPDRVAVRLVERFTYLAAVAIEHHRLFGALAESESRFRSAFEGAASGMALVQLDGTLLKVNPAMSAMLRLRDHATLTTNLLDLIDPTHRRQITDAWENLAGSAVALPVDQRIIEVPLAAPLDADTVWVSLSTSIITDQSGGQRYFYVVVRDISADRRHLEEQRARKIAEAANKAKTDFLALVSHELRTPLNAILGFAQVMQMVDLDSVQRTDGVHQIVQAGSHLRDLINELLDLSRIEAGQLSVVAEEIDSAVAIGEVLDLVRPLATTRDIELIEDDRTAAVHHVHADRRCFRQVLINLVANAVKYTPVGGRVRVDVTTMTDGMVRIGVTDSGPGISPELIAEVFEPFHRLERDGQTNAEGTGLGLALSARLMDEMNGRIGVESTPGTGSCFWVEFPRSAVPLPPGCDQITQLVDTFEK
jgi:PAS domain S-box-containing protein